MYFLSFFMTLHVMKTANLAVLIPFRFMAYAL